MLKHFLVLSARNLWVHKRRNMITGIGLACAFCGVVLLGGYMLRMEGYLATHTIFFRQVGHLSIWKKDGPRKIFHRPKSVTLTPDAQEEIRKTLSPLLHEGDLVVPVLKGQGMITNGCSSFPAHLTAIEPDYFKFVYTHPTVIEKLPELVRLDGGQFLWEKPASDHPILVSRILNGFLEKDALLGDTNATAPSAEGAITDCNSQESRDKSRHDPFVQIFAQSYDGGLGVIDASLSGLMQTGFVFSDETSVEISMADAQKLFGTDNITYFAVFLKDPSHLRSMIRELKRQLDPEKFEVHSYADEVVSEMYVGAMNFVYMMLMFFAILICGVVVLAIVNSFQIAFMERRAEIATLRSIGIRPTDLSRLLALEYTVLAAVSLAFGGLLAFAIKTIINAMNVRFRIPGYANDLQFILQPNAVFTLSTALFILVLVYITSSLLTRKMNKTKIIDLIRAES